MRGKMADSSKEDEGDTTRNRRECKEAREDADEKRVQCLRGGKGRCMKVKEIQVKVKRTQVKNKKGRKRHVRH